MSAKDIRQTARSLEKSLESAHQGLLMLLRSLERSGFKEAISSYQQMQLVLIQQRLWACNYRRDELKPRWKKIAETAAAIHAILEPFSAVMAELKGIDRIEADRSNASQQVCEPAPNDDADNLSHQVCEPAMNGQDSLTSSPVSPLVEVFVERLSVSNYQLSRQLPWSAEEQLTYLHALVEQGVLECRGWGRGQSYQLTSESRQQLARTLVNVLTPNSSDTTG
jgi:hypothetical protein